MERPTGDRSSSPDWVLTAQGVYFLATGLWPLFSMSTFEKVTGPKTDKWLVKTVGVLVSGIGAALLVAARKKDPSPEAKVLALASAVGLAGIDVIYTAKGTIPPIHLADVPPEVAFAASAARRLRRESALDPVNPVNPVNPLK